MLLFQFDKKIHGPILYHDSKYYLTYDMITFAPVLKASQRDVIPVGISELSLIIKTNFDF